MFFFYTDCLKQIMKSLLHKRSENSVITRMIELGMIANRSEIQPVKRKGVEESTHINISDDIEEDSYVSDAIATLGKGDKTPKQKSKPIRKKTHIVDDIYSKIQEMDDDLKEHLTWIQESLNDAAEDFDYDEDSTDPQDGVPLVPYSMAQKQALENKQFKTLLVSLGLQEPLQSVVCIKLCLFSCGEYNTVSYRSKSRKCQNKVPNIHIYNEKRIIFNNKIYFFVSVDGKILRNNAVNRLCVYTQLTNHEKQHRSNTPHH